MIEGSEQNTIHRLDLNNKTWVIINHSQGAIPSPMQGVASLTIGATIYYLGGCSTLRTECVGALFSYDTQANWWTKVKDFSQKAEKISITLSDDQLLAFGGCNLNGECFNTLYKTDVDTYCPNECFAHGTCKMGKCLCNAEYSGFDCSRLNNCKNDCNNSGTCDEDLKCSCNNGFSGETCEIKAVSFIELNSCPLCLNGGLCKEGVCLCKVGFYGSDCGKKLLERGNTLADQDEDEGQVYYTGVNSSEVSL